MGRSDLLTRATAGLVLLVGGLAVADSVRGCDTTTTEARQSATTQGTTSTTQEDGPSPQEEAPANWPEGVLDGVLTFVDADACRVRTIGLAGGRERPPTRFVTDCRGFWAPRVGSRLAFGELPDGQRFRIADLGHPRRNFGSYPVPPETTPVWSFDGQRVAWCDSPDTGVEREILGGGRILPFCPIAYTPEGDLAHVEGERLVVGRRTLVTASGPIDFAQFGEDGSIGMVVDGTMIERYAAGGLATTGVLADGRIGDPVFSPDTCAAAVSYGGDRVSVMRFCGAERRVGVDLDGRAPSWSPDGDWLALSAGRAIVFIRADGSETLTWPATAVQLAWRPG